MPVIVPFEVCRTQQKKLIICMSSTHWHFLWQRPQQLMSRLSKYYNILYVDPPFQVATENKPGLLHPSSFARRIATISHSLKVLSPFQDQAADAIENLQLLVSQIRKALSQLHWSEQPLLWIYNLPASQLIGSLREYGVVYDCVDSFTSFSWADPQTAEWESQLLHRADLVFTSAKTLYSERVQQNKHTYLIPNAADYGHFVRSGSYDTEPPEFKSIPRPRLGFIGAAYEWVDFKLLQAVAQSNPSWNLIMIGPRQHGLELPLEPNIHWLGARDYKMLPWYLQYLDLMIIPFIRNETTVHANPIKLWEYLAAGKMVVATDLPEVPAVSELIWKCQNPEEFMTQCSQALELLKNNALRLEASKRARDIAKKNSWERRCEEIRAYLKQYFNI